MSWILLWQARTPTIWKNAEGHPDVKLSGLETFLSFVTFCSSNFVEILDWGPKQDLSDLVKRTTIRKIFWSIHASHAHINGIGGPGAPHAFRLERFEDAGPLLIINFVWQYPQNWNREMICILKWYFWWIEWHPYILLCLILHAFVPSTTLRPAILGISRENLDTSFWSKRSYVPSKADVVLRTLGMMSWIMGISSILFYRIFGLVRTKRFLSDDNWQPTAFLYLPASIIREAQGTIPAGGSWQWNLWHHQWVVVLLPVFVEPDFNADSDENKKMRKFADLMRPNLRRNIWQYRIIHICYRTSLL